MTDCNANRPGYKKTRVGWIPEEWKVKRLRDLVQINYGKPPKEILDEKGDIPVVGTSDDYRNGNSVLSSKETIVIGRKGSIDNVSYFDKPIWVIDTAFYTTKHNENFPKWLYYYLDYIKLERFDESTGVPSLNRDTLYNIRLRVPPLTEQKKIIEILGTWDRAIEQTRALIAAKRRLKKGLMQQLLTGQMRFPGFGPAVEKKGDLPDGWKMKELRELFSERNEYDPSLPLLSITNENGVIPHDEMGRKDTSSDDKSNYKVIKPGDIGYNTMRMWQGRSALSNLHGIVSPAYVVCKPKANLNSKFASYLFKLPKIVNLFYRYSQGLVSDTWSLKFNHFSKIKIAFPPLPEQEKIGILLSTIDMDIVQTEKKIKIMRKQKMGLMNALLSGSTRISKKKG